MTWQGKIKLNFWDLTSKMINAKLFSRRFKVEKELVKNMVMELVTKKLVKQIGVDGVEGKKAALDVTLTPVPRVFFLAYWCAFAF